MALMGYGFPTVSGILSESLNVSLAMASNADGTLASRECDYFGMSFALPVLQVKSNSTFISPRKPSLRDGAGSISSLTSVSTAVSSHLGSFTAQDFSHSTDTLVDDKLNEKFIPTQPCNSKNVLLLSLTMPRRASTQATMSSRQVPNQKEETGPQLARPDILRKPPHSSTGTHFELAHKYPHIAGNSSLNNSPNQIRAGSVPLLRKQVTAPTFPPIHEISFLNGLKSEQAKRTTQTNFREAILALSSSISYMSPFEVANLIHDAEINPKTTLRNVLPIDIRPLTDFVKSHLTGAINVCLPLTLLKRQNFNLKRCINSLPAYENLVLQNYLLSNSANQSNDTEIDTVSGGKYGLPTLIVYDNVSSSSNLLYMCKKLIDLSCWDSEAAPSIILIDGAFDAMVLQHPASVMSGSTDMIDMDKLKLDGEVEENTDMTCQLAPNLLKSTKAVRSHSTPGFSGLSQPGSASCAALSNFFLPQNLPSKAFRIRHNEEVFNTSMAPCAEDELSAIVLDPSQMNFLPQWLASSVTDKCKIRADFNILENRERERLNRAFGSHEGEIMEETGEIIPSISSGLDFGHKNRYKDIFLFDHSRVKLFEPNTDLLSNSEGEYINASHLDPANSCKSLYVGESSRQERLIREGNYLATQGPMSQTVGDFWRCIVDQRALVIVSLTAEYENGSEKCYPYWRGGEFQSGCHTIRVSIEEVKSIGSIISRVFAVVVDDAKPHRVTQLHHDSWKDMSVDVEIDDILMMLALKQKILASVDTLPQIPTVVHCSAGCGRTGVFCVVDHLINLLEENGTSELPRDPIFELVDAFRRQRVLMVQTVRQYGFLYRIMIRYILGKRRCTSYIKME